jgi:hypothetical protein
VSEVPWPPDRDPLRKLAIIGLVVIALACTGYGVFAWRTSRAPPPPPAPSATQDPYAGTPAQSYAAGTAGITMPDATALGPFSAVDVTDALILVRAALVAGRLDPRMVVQRDPADFLALLAEAERTRVREQFAAGTFAAYATQVAPGYRLAAAEPRVAGRMTYRLATGIMASAVEVVTNFVWVYAFAAPGLPIVVVHDEVTWRVFDVEKVFPDQRGLWLIDSNAYMSNVDCSLAVKAFLAPAQAPVVHPSGERDPDTLYDPARSLDVAKTC